MLSDNGDSCVKVAVRIKPLTVDEAAVDDTLCINVVPGENQIVAGSDLFFTFDNVFGVDTSQVTIFDESVRSLVSSFFEGFNATIIAYGQTGSGKTHTMGSAADPRITSDSMGIIPRVIELLFDTVSEKESNDPASSYKVHVQFLEIYGEDIRDLLDRTKTSKVVIRETAGGDVFVSGAREEIVSSTTQMMKTLEDGSKNRTTASTCMNNESSRSHAIFTVILEHTIHMEPVINEDALNAIETSVERVSLGGGTTNLNNIAHHSAVEVRRSKFHFVDLAGSERIKRTKAQGTQLKEGIDINKGLLSLGNVISALGDEQKKGKILHVPYRDSKITRILQDSLGGNSKTLFVCCVSPASSNFLESVNALKYANRARNIKNKPIVNRDPTLVIIEELKELVQSLAVEILDIKSKNNQIEFSDRFNQESLKELASLNFSSSSRPQGNEGNSSRSTTSTAASRPNNDSGRTLNIQNSPIKPKGGSKAVTSTKEFQELKSKLMESDLEIQRITEQVKILRQNASDLSDRVLMAESERDYYKIKLDSNIVEVSSISPDLDNECDKISAPSNVTEPSDKDDFVSALMKYRQENESLRSQLALLHHSKKATIEEFQEAGGSMESELTSSVARVIAQTRDQLLQEAKRLEKVAEECGLSKSSIQSSLNMPDYNSDSDNEKDEKEVDGVAEEESFQLRQKILSSQLVELGESIVLKENLVEQLKKSQDQYALMKAFYEQKLTILQLEVDTKEGEREKLLIELQDISKAQNRTAVHQDQEKKLKEDLKRKEDELKSLRKKQEELSNLSQVQARYLQQVRKMESDIETMKRQKVDLSKVLQVEKKKHLAALHDKLKEVEKLKRELILKSGEIKKLSQEKSRAEDKARSAMSESAALRKRKNDLVQKTEMSGNRLSNKAIVKMTSMKNSSTTPRFLTLDELKTKKLISNSILKIIQRESSIEILKRHCDQQLTLLAQRDELESQKAAITLTPESTNYEEILTELDDKINSLNQQLKMRNQNIMRSQSALEQGEEVSDMYDKTIDLLKRNLSPNLLRMLFEMVVKAQQSTNAFKDIVDKQQLKQKQLSEEVDGEKLKLAEVSRTHEQEIIEITNDYEAKLQGLFENSSVVRGILAESSKVQVPNDPESIDKFNKDSSIDSYKMVIAILNDKCSYLKNQVTRAMESNEILRRDLNELNISSKQSFQELAESKSLIEFLENERQLFREMANDFKAGILSFGGPSGQSIINQIREKSLEKEKECAARNPRVFKAASSKMDDNVDLNSEINGIDDDSESVMNEFNDLAEEINRTGTLSSQTKSKGVVYDRLTNPSNYTGAMKNIFSNDVSLKKARVQQLKGSQSLPHGKSFNLSSDSIGSHTKLYPQSMTDYVLEEIGKENHEPVMLHKIDEEYDDRDDDNMTCVSEPSKLRNSNSSTGYSSLLQDRTRLSRSTSSSPTGMKRKSIEDLKNKGSVSDRLHSVTTESARLKQNTIKSTGTLKTANNMQ